MRWWSTIALVIGCSKSGSAPEAKATETRATETGDATAMQGVAAPADPCSAAALKLPNAKLLATWEPPVGCTVRGGAAVTLIRAEGDVAASFDCKNASLGIDFATSAIVVKRGQLSPASTGILAFDDGATISFVSRFRDPCPDDPRPMPTPITLVYKISGTSRAFADGNCTVKPTCK